MPADCACDQLLTNNKEINNALTDFFILSSMLNVEWENLTGFSDAMPYRNHANKLDPAAIQTKQSLCSFIKLSQNLLMKAELDLYR